MLLVLLLLASTVCAEVRVFTDSTHPVTAPAGVTVTELDAPARLVATLGAGLPNDPARAEAIMRRRLTHKTVTCRARQDKKASIHAVFEAINVPQVTDFSVSTPRQALPRRHRSRRPIRAWRMPTTLAS
ncbi:DUF1525 domain-containing protein [Acidovorax sp. SUPP3334]|uniref:DUF1525 domain-containing protein n=1 Tax=Acidovorax sp. SUPP3334 TaxID=2920881 RepID=UPI0024E17188|nr:DUF1525 domain-containing protein [Acidovorax sp. SUPP3334]